MRELTWVGEIERRQNASLTNAITYEGQSSVIMTSDVILSSMITLLAYSQNLRHGEDELFTWTVMIGISRTHLNE